MLIFCEYTLMVNFMSKISKEEKNAYNLFKKKIENVEDKLISSMWLVENFPNSSKESIYILLRAWQNFASLTKSFFTGEEIDAGNLSLNEIKAILKTPLEQSFSEKKIQRWNNSFEKIFSYKDSIWKDEEISKDVEESISNLQDVLSVLLRNIVKEINKKYHQNFLNRFVRKLPWIVACFFIIFGIVYFINVKKYGTYNFKNWHNWDDNWKMSLLNQDWGGLGKERTVDGNRCKIGDTFYRSCYGTHADSKIKLEFDSKFDVFSGKCGKDSETGENGSIQCQVTDKDNNVLFESSVLTQKSPIANFSVSVKGKDSLFLNVFDGKDGKNSDHADWVDLKLE